MQALREKKVFLIDTLAADFSFVLQFAQQNEIIIQREYRNLNHPNHTPEMIITNLLDKVMNKDEDTCRKFLKLLENEELQKTFPKLKEHFTSAPPAPHQACPDKPFDEISEYRMSSMPRGFCVIINNRDFEEHNKKKVKPHLKYRTGSDEDEDSLKGVFEWLGFTVEVHRDQRAEEMKDLLEKVSQRDHVGDCFVCCILSHGCTEGVYGTDGGVVPSDDIFGPFRGTVCPSLAGKPKAFFIQACRGEDYQRKLEVQADSMDVDGEDEEEFEMDNVQMITIPNDGDFLVARSTVKDFVFIRSPSGTWFIQSLCEQLRKYCPKCEDIQSILICVNEEVSRKIATLKIKCRFVKVKQMPVQKVTLRKKLVFRVPSKISCPS